MKKLRVFSVMLAYLPLALMALGLVFISCEEPDNGGGSGTKTFTVTFNLNGGNGTAPAAQTAKNGESITLPGGSGLTRSDYTFGGWNTNTAGTGTNYSAGVSFTPSGNVTLYAKWIAEGTTNFTVTFNANGGSGTVPSTRTASAGSSITLPGGSGLSKIGFTFGGWNTNSSGTGTNYSAGVSFTPSGNITLYAKWVEAVYTARELTIAMWDSVGDGWDSSAALRINVNGTNLSQNARLAGGGGPGYYRFDVDSGDVVQIYWVSGGEYDSEIAFAVYYSDDPPSPAFNPSTGTTDTGRVLVSKRYNNPSGAVGNGASMGSFTVGGAAATYYTVTFDSNGGVGTVPNQRVPDGSSVTLPSGSGLSKTDYAFGGWNIDPNGTGTNYSVGESFTPSGDVTLYARWIVAGTDTYYTVTFDSNGGVGTAPNQQRVRDGSSVNLPSGSGLSKTGYAFGGWNTDPYGTGTNYDAGFSYTVIGDVPLYANWVIAYTVTFNANGGSGTAPFAQKVQAGSSITLPNRGSLSMTSATFTGWNNSADGTGTNYSVGESFTPSGDVILYANWEVTTYTITFNANGGSGTGPSSRQVPKGYSTTLPNRGNLSRASATFTGWNTNADGSGTFYDVGSTYWPTGNRAAITLYAQWDILPFSSVTGLNNQLNWIQAYAQSNTSYTLEVEADEGISPRTLSYSNKSNITITLVGVDMNRTVSLSSNGTMFTVNSGVTLILDNNITLQGRYNNINSLVKVAGGTLIMNEGSAISDNRVLSPDNGLSFYGGGVCVESGTFTMIGGTISGNTAYTAYGGGVYVGSGGTFTMIGGTISGNTASGYNTAYGGGVYVADNGAFTMSGGTISGNTAYNYSSYSSTVAYGGGVYVGQGTFNKTGGTIYGYDANDTVNSNVVKNSSGSVLSGRGHAVHGGTVNGVSLRRETTAEGWVNLYCDGSSFSGEWEF